MSRFSRACVHSAWMVYIAEPSAWMLSTLRSGQAIAAPVAIGMPRPIEPPMFCSQVCGCALRVEGKKPRPVETPSSTTMPFWGISAPIDCASVIESILPVASGSRWGGVLGGLYLLRRGTRLMGEPLQRVDRIFLDGRQRGELRVLRRQK